MIEFPTLIRGLIGLNLQLECSQVESEKGKNRPKSHRVESRKFKS
mgnify:CR=1 FL=1